MASDVAAAAAALMEEDDDDDDVDFWLEKLLILSFFEDSRNFCGVKGGLSNKVDIFGQSKHGEMSGEFYNKLPGKQEDMIHDGQ